MSHRTTRPAAIVLGLILLSGPLQSCSAERTSENDSTPSENRTEETSVPDQGSDVPTTNGSDSVKAVADTGRVTLSQTIYIVEDTATTAALRLYIRNTSREISLIDHVKPSCGCIMTTVQRSKARPGDSAEIYIGLLPDQMSRTQPYAVDVYMTSSPTAPLRLTIWKREAYENR